MGTYYGTTASSSLSNPPVPISGGLTRGAIGTGPPAANSPNTLWWYSSTNTAAEVSAANFITDGYYLGMRSGDVLLGSYISSAGSTSGNSYRCLVTGVTTSGVSFSTGQLSTG